MFFLFIVCGLKISLLFFMFFPLCFCVVMLVAGQYHGHCFWTSNRHLVQRSVVTLAYTHRMELMKCIVVIDKLLSYMFLLMLFLTSEMVTVAHTASVYLLFLHSSFVPFLLFLLPSCVSPYQEV
jgi:hypothetical protein